MRLEKSPRRDPHATAHATYRLSDDEIGYDNKRRVILAASADGEYGLTLDQIEPALTECVEAVCGECMRRYATSRSGDPDEWECVGTHVYGANAADVPTLTEMHWANNVLECASDQERAELLPMVRARRTRHGSPAPWRCAPYRYAGTTARRSRSSATSSPARPAKGRPEVAQPLEWSR